MPSRPEELEHVARRFHEHQLHDPFELVADLMCEDAEMVLLANNLEPVQGRPAILKALERGRAAEIYRAWVDRFEWLDDDTVLLFGQARYAPDGAGISVSRVWWVDQFQEGRLRRAHAFLTEDEARRAYAPGRPGEITPHTS